MREYTNQEYRDVLRNTSLNSPLVDEKLAQVYGKIRREEKKKKLSEFSGGEQTKSFCRSFPYGGVLCINDSFLCGKSGFGGKTSYYGIVF